MAQAGLERNPAAVGVGLNEPDTMAERTRQARALADLGMPLDEAADLAGMRDAYMRRQQVRAPELEPEAEAEFGYGDLARYGAQRAAQSMLRGGTALAEDYLDLSQDTEDAAEAAATRIGPSEEQERRAAEFMADKGVLGQAADAIVMEAPVVAGTIAAGVGVGAAAGAVAGPPGAALGAFFGGLLGAAQGVTRLYDEASQNLDAYNRDQIAAERGIAPEEVSDEEVQARFSEEDRLRASAAATVGIANALPLGRVISKLTTGRKVLQNAAEKVLEKRSLLAGASREAATVGLWEGLQEVSEELALDVLTNRQLHAELRELPEKDLRTVAKFLRDARGENYAVSFLAGFGLGGGPGAVAGAQEARQVNEEVMQRQLVEDRTQRLVGLAEQRGIAPEEIEERVRADPSLREPLGRGVEELDFRQSRLDQAEALLTEARANDAPEETVAALAQLRDRRAEELDAHGDRFGEQLGLRGWKTAADTRRAAADRDRERRQDALDRLKERGERVSDEVDTETAAQVADRLETVEAAYEQASARHDAISNPERRAEARTRLDEARAERHEARIEAAQKLRGRTHAQAVREVDKSDRIDRQREAREEAIRKQAEIELPETMEPAARRARAQEIVDEFEANPMEGTRGLQSKIRRLERQRRAATSPETIDRLSGEIADLEARRGLSPPAVEAARRVLQDQGPVAQAGLEEASPEAGGTGVEEASEAEARMADEADLTEGAPGVRTSSAATATAERVTPELAETARRVSSALAGPDLEAATDADYAAIEAEARRRSGVEDDAAVHPDVVRTVADELAAEAAAMPQLAAEAKPPPTTTREAPPDQGYDLKIGLRNHKWRDLGPEFAGLEGFTAIEKAMADWTVRTGMECCAHLTQDGRLLAIGTNDLKHSVMAPKRGWQDPEVVFTHTHPVGAPLSTSDIYAALEDGQPIRAVMGDGTAIEVRPLRAVSRAELDQVLDAAEIAVIQAYVDQGGGENFTASWHIEEVFARALDAAGVIDYTSDWLSWRRAAPGFDQFEISGDLIHAAIDRLEEPIRALRLRTDGRAHPSQDRGRWESAGRARNATEEDIAEDEDDLVDIEDLFALGGRVSDRRRGQNRPAADPERVAELARDVIARSNAKRGSVRGKLDRAIRDGEVTEATLADAIQQLFQGDGNKKHYVVQFAAQKLFPDVEWGDRKHIVRKTERDSVTKERKDYWGYDEETESKLDLALTLLNDIRNSGHGGFMRIANEVINERGFPFTNYYHLVSDELKQWAGFKVPAPSRLLPPPDDPDDTSMIVRDLSKNMLPPESLEAMERSARYLQRQQFGIDLEKLDRLVPNDLISSKSLGARGLRKAEALPRHDRLFAMDPKAFTGRRTRRPPGMSQEDFEFMREHSKRIREMQISANLRLQHLRDAVAQFREEFGPDAKVGYLWQIDNRGRIYPEGEWHPQQVTAVKGIFTHEGRNLVDDMVSVDASASGWQIAALAARDQELAPRVNLGRGQADEPGFVKSDLYDSTTTIMQQILDEDAASADVSASDRRNAEILRDLWPSLPTDRDMVKKPIIAMNYGGEFRTFSRAFAKLLKPHLKNVKGLDQPYGYLARVALRALERQAPHALRMQNWAIDSIARLVRKVEAKYGPGVEPELPFRIGVRGKLQTWKHGSVKVKFSARAANRPVFARDAEDRIQRDADGKPIIVGTTGDHVTQSNLKVRTLEVASAATARSLWSNMVQSLDAAILHRTLERYRRATDGAFITPSHDALTVPREHEGIVASAYRESMKEIVSQVDLPRRLYEDIQSFARMHGVEVDVEPFTDLGSYNLDDIDSSTPVFADDKGQGRKDDVPAYAALPDEGPILREATPAPSPRNARSSAVDVAGYMEQYEGGNAALTYMQEAAQNPSGVISRSLRTIDRNIVQEFQPIRTLERRVRGDGTLGQGMDSAFKAAEMAKYDSGRNEVLLYYGAGAFGPHGEFRPAEGTVGLREIFDTASGGRKDGQKLQHWFEYMAARRARALQAEGVKTPLTEVDIEAALARADDGFRQAEEMWHAHNRANLRMLLESGRISREQHDAMAEDDLYIPFYRADQRLDGSPPEFEPPRFVRTAGGALKARDPGIRAIKGGDKMRIANMAENMVRNSQTMVAAAMRNVAANKTFELMEQAGIVDIAPASDKKPHKDAIRRWVDGREEWVIPRDEDAVLVASSLAGMRPVQLDRAMRFINGVSNVYRMSVTTSPSFILTNLFRGMVANGILTKGANLMPGGNTLTGIASVAGAVNPEAYREFKAISGMGDFRLGQAPVGFGQNDMLIDFGLQKADVSWAARKLYNLWETAGVTSEMADRVAVYQTMRKRGVRPDEAAYQALNVMNYNRKGSNETLRIWISTMPFLNARLQGYARLLEGAVGRNATPATRLAALGRMLTTGLIWTMMTVAAWRWNNEDEERRETYQALPAWRRTMFLNIVQPFGHDFVLTLPQPFELGFIFSAIPSAIMDDAAATMASALRIESDGDSATIKEIEGAAMEISTKIAADIMAFDLVPHAVAPMMEAQANYDRFFGNPIETRAEQDLPAELRTTNADEFAKFVGTRMGLSKLRFEVLGKEFDLRLSPAKLSHYGDNYGGLPYTMMAGLFDTFAAKMGLAPPKAANLFGEGPTAHFTQRALRNFVFDPSVSRTRFAEEFYRVGDKLTEAMGGARRTQEGTYLGENLEAAETTVDAYRLLNRIKSGLSELNTMRKDIEDSETLTPQEKRRGLQRITRAQNTLYQRGFEVLAPIAENL